MLLAVFCLRLACGMLACLLLLPRALIGPRFYRTHFLTALGLTTLATLFLREAAPGPLLGALLAGLALAFLGSLLWAVEGAPGGLALVVLTAAVLATALGLYDRAHPAGGPPALRLAGDLTSAALLGSALTAMLLGHFYLIAPALSTRPLLRLLAAVALAAWARMAFEGYDLYRWTAPPSCGTLTTDRLLWLPLRWGVGFLGPLALDWMAWQAARIRSTQSATGILYVVVIFCFLGELTSQLLQTVVRGP